MLTGEQMTVAAVIEVGAGFIQGTIGFGSNALAVPLLLLLSFRFVPVPVVVASLFGSVLVLWRDRPWPGLGSLRWAIAGRIPGSFIGAALLTAVSSKVASLTIAAMVLAAVAVSGLSGRVAHNRVTLFGTGVVSGITGTVAGLGGVPLGLLHQRVPGGLLRRMMSAYVLVGGLVSLTVLALRGRVGADDAVPSLVLLPAVAVGYFFATKALAHADARIRPIVLGISAAAAIGVIATSVW